MGIAEVGLGLVPRHGEVVAELRFLEGGAHALPASAGGCLDHDRKPDAAGFLQRFILIVDGLRRARHHGNARLDHRLARLGLVPHAADLVGRGSDEHETAPSADLREFRVLRQESVPGMYGVGARDLGRRKDLRDVQIALAPHRWTDADVLVGEADMERVVVGLRVYGDRPDIEFTASAQDAEARSRRGWRSESCGTCARPRLQSGSMQKSSAPYSTGSAFSTATSRTTPATSD